MCKNSELCPCCKNGIVQVDNISDSVWPVTTMPNKEPSIKALGVDFYALRCLDCGEVFLNGNQIKEIQMILEKNK